MGSYWMTIIWGWIFGIEAPIQSGAQTIRRAMTENRREVDRTRMLACLQDAPTLDERLKARREDYLKQKKECNK
jgi:hypothetical protein